MTEGRQFIECAFAEGGRTYTYHNDGEPVRAADRVEVETRGGGKRVVEVVSVLDEEPEFVTKGILGLAPSKQDETEETEEE